MADLSLPISYNGFSVNTVSRSTGGAPMSGYLVDEMNVSALEVRQFLDPRATADGIDASDVYLGRRSVELIVTVYGSTRGDFWDKAQDLLSHFSPTLAYASDSANLGFLPLDWYQPTADVVTFPVSAYSSGIPMRMYLRPNGLPAYTSRRDDQGGQSGKGISKQFRIPLLARDPRKVLQSETTVSIASTTASASSSATYKGDYPAGLGAYIKIVSGSASVSGVTINVDDTFALGAVAEGHKITIPSASQTVFIDLYNRVYRLNSLTGTIRSDLFTAGTWRMPGTQSTVTLMKGAHVAPFSCSVVYRDAFA